MIVDELTLLSKCGFLKLKIHTSWVSLIKAFKTGLWSLTDKGCYTELHVNGIGESRLVRSQYRKENNALGVSQCLTWTEMPPNGKVITLLKLSRIIRNCQISYLYSLFYFFFPEVPKKLQSICISLIRTFLYCVIFVGNYTCISCCTLGTKAN